MRFLKHVLHKPWLLPLFLLGCGGESEIGAYRELVSSLDWTQGVFFPADNYENLCENPGEGQSQGTVYDENMWLRSWTNDVYLWYDEVEDVDPAGYSVTDYFGLLKTKAKTPSGNDKDRFHFYYRIEDWNQRQAGIVSGYGLRLSVVRNDPAREITIVLVEAGSPADAAGLRRGEVITKVNGFDLATYYDPDLSSEKASIDAGLSPREDGEQHNFTVRALNGEEREVTMVSGSFVTGAVIATEIVDTAGGAKVGYVAFKTHNLVAQDALVESFQSFSDAGVNELVLDLRYNGGGYLAVASQLAYMIAGPEQSNNKVFEKLAFNDKHTEFNPFTGGKLEPLNFNTKTIEWLGELPAGNNLPTLNLERVVVLTTGNTCSASESTINSLRGIDIEVIQVGSTTCGKPYGFYGTENCENIYFSINMRGENDKGFGDYADGFSPENLPSNQSMGVSLPGCYARDDLQHQLGDANEEMFAKAIRYLDFGDCDVLVQKSGLADTLSKGAADAAQQAPIEYLNPVEGMKIYR